MSNYAIKGVKKVELEEQQSYNNTQVQAQRVQFPSNWFSQAVSNLCSSTDGGQATGGISG